MHHIRPVAGKTLQLHDKQHPLRIQDWDRVKCQLTWPLADSEGDAEMWGVVSFGPFSMGWDRVGAPCTASALGLGLRKGQGNEWADRCE